MNKKTVNATARDCITITDTSNSNFDLRDVTFNNCSIALSEYDSSCTEGETINISGTYSVRYDDNDPQIGGDTYGYSGYTVFSGALIGDCHSGLGEDRVDFLRVFSSGPYQALGNLCNIDATSILNYDINNLCP